MTSHTEEIDGNEVVWAEAIGVGVSTDPELPGPTFCVALTTPGGGKVMWGLDAIGAIEYATRLLSAVTTAMNDWEPPEEHR